ncbi:MAG: HlyC/CorC family transporter, partial [Planctomycetes bacterium]|nr:HlyC/CorC family transporter [Planctomycetota bacterium]
YTSLGGLISTRLGRIPAPGEELAVDGVVLRVLESTERQVRRVQIERREDEQEAKSKSSRLDAV